MIKVKTDRLEILPLDEENLKLAISNYSEMIRRLGLSINNNELNDREKKVYKIRLNGVENNSLNYMWYTTWIIVLRNESRHIGKLMIKGYPNNEGEVIVGYALEERDRHKGYMTEALKGIIQWIFLNPEAKYVVADTLKNNAPSHRVLERAGMKVYKEDDECFWWRVSREDLLIMEKLEDEL